MKSIGIAKRVTVHGTTLTADELYMTGVLSRFAICGVSVLGSSKEVFPVSVTYASSPPTDKFDYEQGRLFFCPYREVRFRSINITVEPTSARSQYQGMLYVALLPIRNADALWHFKNLGTPTINEFAHMQIKSIARFGTPISISYTPTAHDGDTFQFGKLEDPKFGVVILFADQNRTSGSTFTGNDYAVAVKITASVEMRNPRTTPLALTLTPKGTGTEDTYSFKSTSDSNSWLYREKIIDIAGGSEITDRETGQIYDVEPGSFIEENGRTVYRAHLALEGMD